MAVFVGDMRDEAGVVPPVLIARCGRVSPRPRRGAPGFVAAAPGMAPVKPYWATWLMMGVMPCCTTWLSRLGADAAMVG